MSSGALPDEIIREILTPALKVPDEIFRNTSSVSPFLTATESSSAFLLVCKSWLRVATPLLYHVVVLRSRAQVRALERALRGNDVLAAFIKKLRVEGGFGVSMHHILRLSKNIEEIWMKLSIWSADSVNGLCSSLHLINPRRLIIPDDVSYDNAPTRKLVDTVCACITLWDRLSIIDLPFQNMRSSFVQSSLLAALPKVKSLKMITLKDFRYDKYLLLTLARNPYLEVIHINKSGMFNGGYWKSKMKDLMADEKLGKLLRCDFMDEDDDMDVADDLLHDEEANPPEENVLTFDPSFVALQSATEEVKAEIWSNIIYFSLLRTDTVISGYSAAKQCSRHENSFFSEIIPDTTYTAKVLRLNILLVSKLFYNIAIRHYYRHCLLDDDQPSMRGMLSGNPSFGSAIYHLATDSYSAGYRQSIRDLLTSATNLVHLTSNRDRPREQLLDYQTLATLASQVGSKLQTLTGHSIARTPSPKASTPLYAFTALRVLDWESSLRLKFKSQDVPVDAFPCLEWLTVVSTNSSFLELLRCMDLPALRHVAFPVRRKSDGAEKFLHKHGKKLLYLKMEDATRCWKLCPSLQVIIITGPPTLVPHAKVETIIFTTSKSRESEKYQALGTIDFGEDFPTLGEIQVYFCHWPINEREIRTGPRSKWVKWSERLMEWNVKLTDREGKHWKPRLK